jgi:hypothetical protein
MTAVTPLDRASLNAWPSRPKPVTSVAQARPAARAALLASAFSALITATACGCGCPVALCQELSTPEPIGLVRLSGWPGGPASIRSSSAGSASPVTAMPYLGSGSSMLCPPATRQPARPAASSPPRSTSPASSALSFARGQPSRFSATSGSPPTAYTSDWALVAAMTPNVYASSTTGVKKSAVATTAWPSRSSTTAASSPCSRPISRPGWAVAGSSAATASSSSPGGILHAQPPPLAY